MSDNSNTQINVAQLLKSATGAAREYELEASVPSLGRDIQLTQPVVGRVKLTRINDGILAQGHFATAVELVCDRCLGLFHLPVEFDVEEKFVPVIDINTGKWRLLDDEEEIDPAVLIDDHHILDLEEVFRQAIYLELPLHAVCQPDCRGMCPRCGTSLNEGLCTCADDEADPRWEALRDLKEG